jgi:hypothetical protein
LKSVGAAHSSVTESTFLLIADETCSDRPGSRLRLSEVLLVSLAYLEDVLFLNHQRLFPLREVQRRSGRLSHRLACAGNVTVTVSVTDSKESEGMFRLSVLGDFTLRAEAGDAKRLDVQTQHLVSVLVAANGHPMTPMELAYELSVGDKALKNWLSRRRRLLTADVFPRLTKGDPGYLLHVDRHDVDAWWLLDQADRPLENATDEQLIAVLQPGEPFPGVPGTDTDLLDSARRQIRRAQRSIALAVVRADRRIVMAAIAGLLESIIEDYPYDEEVAEANARLQAVIYGRQHGLEALHQTRLRLLGASLSPSSGLQALELELLGDPPVDEGGRDERAPAAWAPSPLPAGLPSSVTRLRADPYLAKTLPTLPEPSGQSRWLVASGSAGAGKTALVAELAAGCVDSGAVVLHLEPFRFGPEPWFRLFEVAMPDVQQLVAELTDAQADIAAFRHAVMTAVRAALEELAASGPMLLMVTKAHRLEAEAVEVLWYLARSPLPGNLTVVVAGDTTETNRSSPSHLGDEVSPAWESFARDLVVSGFGQVLEVPRLGREEVDQLIRQLHPGLGRHQSLLLAAKIVAGSDGLPGLILPLARSLSVDSLRLGGDEPVEPGAWQLVSRLPEEVKTPGAVAAVCGLRFSAQEVAEILGAERELVVEALNRLYNRSIVAPEAPTGHYRFTTAAVARAFLETALPEQLLIWRQRAADVFADDPIRRARQVVAFAPEPEACEALIEAAEAHVARGQHHEAAAAFELAVSLSPGHLRPRDCVGYVRALDLSGRHEEAEKVRSDALQRGLEVDDHSTALALLLASWPEAELFADAEELVARLDALDPEKLTPDERVVYAQYWSRHLTMAGRADDASTILREAEAFTTSPTQKVGLAVASRFVEWTRSSPAQCLELLDGVRPLLPEVEAARRVDLLAHAVVDAYESGLTERLEAARAELWAVVDQAGPVRRWHALLLDAVLAADAGDTAAAAIHRRDAFEHAVAHGLRHALEVNMASELAERWLYGLPLDGEAQFEGTDFLRLQHSPAPAGAGLALLLDAGGESEQAIAVAEQVAENALQHSHFLSYPSAAIVAPILARSRRERLRLQTRDLLLRRGNLMLVMGAFIAGLGPVTRYAEHLEPSRSERARLRTASRQLAEQTGWARWLELIAE